MKIGEFRALRLGERYNYTKETGRRIRERLMESLDELQAMTSAEAKDFVQKVARVERTAVKREMQ